MNGLANRLLATVYGGSGRFSAAKRIFDSGIVKVAFKIDRHIGDLDVEQVVNFIFVNEGAPINRADTRNPGALGRQT